MTAVISLVSGLLAGMLFSKAAEALMVNMLQGQVSYTLTVSVPAIVQTVVLFAIIFTGLLAAELSIMVRQIDKHSKEDICSPEE